MGATSRVQYCGAASPHGGFPGASVIKNSPGNAGGTGDVSLILESGRFP